MPQAYPQQKAQRIAHHISILKHAVQDEPDGFLASALDVNSQPPLTKLLKADESHCGLK